MLYLFGSYVLTAKTSILQSHCSHSLRREDPLLTVKETRKPPSAPPLPPHPRTLHHSPGTRIRPRERRPQHHNSPSAGPQWHRRIRLESRARTGTRRAGSPNEEELLPQLQKEGRTNANAQARGGPACAGEPQTPCATPVLPGVHPPPALPPWKYGRTDAAPPAQDAALGLCRGRGRGAPAQHPRPAAPRYLRSLSALPPPGPLPHPRAASARAARPKPRPPPLHAPPARPARRPPPSGGREQRQRREGTGATPAALGGICPHPCSGQRNGGWACLV